MSDDAARGLKTRPAWHPFADGTSLKIEISDRSIQRTDDQRDRTNQAWAQICSANPRAFDGPILAYETADAARNLVRARRENYSQLAVLPEVETGVNQLGVTGVLEAKDACGASHVLLGLRSHSTRVFGGMWEFAPSGGVDPPPQGVTEMDASDLWRVLLKEIDEEIGLPIEPDSTPPLGLFHDPEGRSVELVVRVQLASSVKDLASITGVQDREQRWEYDAVRWVAVNRLASFMQGHLVIPSVRGIFSALDW